jgi:hypothetical protein
MAGQFRENWKRLTGQLTPKGPTAIDAQDVVRIEDLGAIFTASGVVTVSGIPSSGDLLVGGNGIWTILSSGDAGQVLTVVDGALGWATPTGDGAGAGALGPGDVTISGDLTVLGNIITSGTFINSVSSGTGPTVIISNLFFNAISSGTTNVILPQNPVVGQTHVIKDVDGFAGTTAITVQGSGDNIDGLASRDIASDYGSMSLFFGPKFEWNIW